MTVYIITYDLKEPEQDYDQLYEAIQSLGEAVYMLDSVWFLEFEDFEAKEIKDELKTHVSSNDELFVSKISSSGYSWATNFSSDETDWLKENI